MGITALTVALVFAAASPPSKAAASASGAGATAIVELDSPDTMIGLAAQVNRALSEEAARMNLVVIKADDIRLKIGPKAYTELVKCGPKPACVQGQLALYPDLKRVVVGSLNRDEKAYLLKLALIDLKSMEVVTDVDRSITIASRRFQHDVQALVGPFLRGERDPKGTLVITCTAKNAQVSIDGEFVGVAPVTAQLKPGKHEVKVERSKYLPATRQFAVEPNQTTTEEVRLILQPGQRPDEEELPGMKPVADGTGATAGSENAGGAHLSAATWVVGAVAIASFGVATYFALTENGLEKNLSEHFDSVHGIYQGTRAQALSAQTDALLANVFWGVGGAAAIVTAILIYFDLRTPVTVAPTAGAGGAALLFQGSF